MKNFLSGSIIRKIYILALYVKTNSHFLISHFKTCVQFIDLIYDIISLMSFHILKKYYIQGFFNKMLKYDTYIFFRYMNSSY